MVDSAVDSGESSSRLSQSVELAAQAGGCSCSMLTLYWAKVAAVSIMPAAAVVAEELLRFYTGFLAESPLHYFLPIGSIVFGLCYPFAFEQEIGELKNRTGSILRFSLAIILAYVVGSTILLLLFRPFIVAFAAGLAARRFLGFSFDRAALLRITALSGLIAGLGFCFTVAASQMISAGAVSSFFGLLQAVFFLPLGLIIAGEALGKSAASTNGKQGLHGEEIEVKAKAGAGNRVVLAIAFIPPLLLASVSAALKIYSYDGFCYGFTDGKWPCSLFERMINGSALELMFFGPGVLAWILLSLLFVRKRVR